MDSPLSMQFELPSPDTDLLFTRVNTRLSPEARQKIKDTLASSFGRLTTLYTATVDPINTSINEDAQVMEQEVNLEPLISQIAAEWRISSARVKLNSYAHLMSSISSKALSDSKRTYDDDGILDMNGEYSLGKRNAFTEDFYDADLFRSSKISSTNILQSGFDLQNVIFDYPDNCSAQSFCEIQTPELSKNCSMNGTATPTCDNRSSHDADSCETSLVATKKRLVQLMLKSMVSSHFSHKSEEGLTTLISSLYRVSDL